MASFMSLLKGLGIGAGVMYLFDPVAGQRRRTELRHRAVGFGNDMRETVDRRARDFSDTVSNKVSGWRSWFKMDHTTDEVIADRVHTFVKRYVAHPDQIDVSVQNGCIVLTGPIPSAEAQRFIRAVESLRGVAKVENKLAVYEAAESFGSLRARGRAMLRKWATPPRVLAATTALGLVALTATRSKLASAALGGVGLGLLVRGAKDQVDRKRQAADVQDARRAAPKQRTGKPVEVG